jgi:hypothetical protein
MFSVSDVIVAEVLVPAHGDIQVRSRTPVERQGQLGPIVYDFACNPRPIGRYIATQDAQGGVTWSDNLLQELPGL